MPLTIDDLLWCVSTMRPIQKYSGSSLCSGRTVTNESTEFDNTLELEISNSIE